MICHGTGISIQDVLNQSLPELDLDQVTVKCGGRLMVDFNSSITGGAFYHVTGKIMGGKGGFGSLLRAIGMQIEKTRNKEACRDLSGRRMRDVNNEKK